jgi:hypothetical protein
MDEQMSCVFSGLFLAASITLLDPQVSNNALWLVSLGYATKLGLLHLQQYATVYSTEACFSLIVLLLLVAQNLHINTKPCFHSRQTLAQ